MHLSGMIMFSAKGRLRGAVPPSVNLGPLISRFFVRRLLCVKLFLCFSFFATFVKVRVRSNVVVNYVKDSHYATALCGVV